MTMSESTPLRSVRVESTHGIVADVWLLSIIVGLRYRE